jgi:hypothetical protein
VSALVASHILPGELSGIPENISLRVKRLIGNGRSGLMPGINETISKTTQLRSKSLTGGNNWIDKMHNKDPDDTDVMRSKRRTQCPYPD